ncbi:MAG: ATP-binding protein [Spirochaetia bacterium]
MAKVKILIVEDESIVAMDIKRRLVALGYQVIGHALSGEDAVSFSGEQRPDLVLMDIHLKGDMDGIKAADEIRRNYEIPVIYITAYSDEATLDRAKVTEPFGYILKPFQEREVHSAIEMAIYKHRAEQELREAKEAAVEGYKARSKFLANISHELRTPLNSILGMTQIAMDTENRNERNEYLSMAKDSGNHLLSLINSILEFSKMEAGKLELVEQPFQLDELIEEELYLVWSTETSEELELYVSIDEKSIFSLRGDAARLRQIFRNLLQNAVKFTPSGYVSVEVSTKGNIRTGRVELEVSVSDTGIGIPEKEKEEIFSLFYKLDNSLTMVQGGTGLGLAIVKNLIEMMDGSISLVTEEERGSTFTFTVPMKIDRKEMRPPLSLPSNTKVRLICDDSRTEKVKSEQIEGWNGKVYVQKHPCVEGKTDDIWCVFGKRMFTEGIKKRLLTEGVPKSKILVSSPVREEEHGDTDDVYVLPFFGGRKEFFKLLSEAAKAEVPRGKQIQCTLEEPVKGRNESTSVTAQDRGTSALGSWKAVFEIIGAFLNTGYTLLDKENFLEIEETALQLKVELEQWGYKELRDLLFKVVLAGRKEDKAAVKKALDNLKESNASRTIEE